MMSRLFALVLTLAVLLSLATTVAAQQDDPTDNTSPTEVLPSSSALVDPLDVRQGGGVPPFPPSATMLAPAPTGALASGNPPLTQQIADGFAGTLMWVLDAPLTQTQSQDLRDALVQTWAAGDAGQIAVVTQLADVDRGLSNLGETGRLSLREQLQPAFVSQLRDASDPFSRWMLDIYDSAHRPIAPGSPPLTRQVSDAHAEVMYFVLKVVATGDGDMSAVTLDRPILDTWAASLASDYPSYTPEQQQVMARMPLFRAAATEGWSGLPRQQQAQLRDAWRPIAQDFLSSASCKAFTALARGGLVEPTDTNRTRFSDCGGSAPSPAPAQPGTGPTLTASDIKRIGAHAYQEAMNEMQSRHNTYVGLSNMMMSNHVTMMNAINNIGNSPYTYVLH